jgi:hypothetical protein
MQSREAPAAGGVSPAATTLARDPPGRSLYAETISIQS